jgi:hypothetical protein
VLVVAVLAVLILWDGDEPVEPTPEATAPAAGDRQAGRREAPAPRATPGADDWYARPRTAEPPWPPRPAEQPGAGYETADPWYYGQPPGGALQQPYPQAPARSPYDYQPGYAGQPGYAPGDPRAQDRYQFRPLTEQERERMEQSYPTPAYPSPYYSVPDPRREPPPAYTRQPEAYPGGGYGTGQDVWPGQPYAAPEHYAAEPYAPPQPGSGWQGGWQGDGYSFRPRERSPRAAGRLQGPDRGLGWQEADPGRGNAWTPPSQQGWELSPPAYTPPAERMYPSLPGDPDRRFTYR